MSEGIEATPFPLSDVTCAHSRRRRKAKAYKALEGKLRFVVGHDVYMERVEALYSRALIGILEYCQMDKKA